MLKDYLPDSQNVNLQKIPALHREILTNFLIPLNPDSSITCSLNILNSKFAQMATYRKIRFKESQFSSEKIISYYGINFVPSGGGKDKIVNELDKCVFVKFKNYFNERAQDILRDNETEIDRVALLKYSEPKKAKEYADKQKEKLRNLRYEIKDGTPEGLYSDCLNIQSSPNGSLFVRIPELGLYFKNPSPAQQQFINMIIELYEGEVSIKSTKQENKSKEIENVHCNCLFYSDITLLLKGSGKSYSDDTFEAGLIRRAFVSHQPAKALTINYDPDIEAETNDRAYKYAFDNLQEKIFKTFMAIPQNAVYQLSKETRKILHEYKCYNKERYNSSFDSTDSIALKELQGRFWKCLKLAGIIAAWEHPQERVIKKQDILYAVYMTELFAMDLQQFFKAKPKTDIDELFFFLAENKDKWVTKGEIKAKGITAQNKFSNWFDENLAFVQEIAEKKGLIIVHEKFGHNKTGDRYMLKNNYIGQELSSNIAALENIL